MDVKICKACGKSIAFVKTAKGRRMPVDLATWHAGDEFYDDTRHVPHWTTCTDPQKFRKASPAGKLVQGKLL